VADAAAIAICMGSHHDLRKGKIKDRGLLYFNIWLQLRSTSARARIQLEVWPTDDWWLVRTILSSPCGPSGSDAQTAEIYDSQPSQITDESWMII
jgi:hypothetical protein